MLHYRRYAVFVGKECCVQVAKVLKVLSFSPAPPPYAANQDNYTAVLRYKLSYANIQPLSGSRIMITMSYSRCMKCGKIKNVSDLKTNSDGIGMVCSDQNHCILEKINSNKAEAIKK